MPILVLFTSVDEMISEVEDIEAAGKEISMMILDSTDESHSYKAPFTKTNLLKIKGNDLEGLKSFLDDKEPLENFQTYDGSIIEATWGFVETESYGADPFTSNFAPDKSRATVVAGESGSG